VKNPAAYCNRCFGIIEKPLRGSNQQECSNIALYALLDTVLARVESPVYHQLEVNYPIVSTQSDVIRRMLRTLSDIAADIHQVIDRKQHD
jgi:hypothetical protein